MTPAEARRHVRTLVTIPDEDRVAGVRAWIGDGLNDADELKVAQYAMLVKPIQRGVRDLLTFNSYRLDHNSTANKIVDRLGRDVHDAVHARLVDFAAPGMYGLIDELAERRTVNLRPEHASMVAPFNRALHSAALSAALASYTAAEANAHVAARAHSMEGVQLGSVPVTRNSPHLTLAHQMVHLEDHALVNLILRSHNALAQDGRTYPEQLLRYEPGNGRARIVLARSISHWHLGPTLTVGDVASRHADVRIGCPFTFAPARLRIDFYQLLVDLAL